MSDTTTSGQSHHADTNGTAAASTHGTSSASVELSQPSIGPYSLLEKLGEGGMGAVYKAMHVNLKKVMAIKVLSSHRELRRGMVDRFYREMEAIGRLDHPNLVRATDAGTDHGHYFLVMEYVDGEDVAKVLRRRKTLPVAEACSIVRQAAQGLQYLADHKLVHRDIKPSNLMVTASGQVKILDLGLALLQREATDEASELTNPGQVMGTWDYMAPEQTHDAHQVDIRADIYSLGCTLYKMLTGHAPFASTRFATNRAKMQAHRAVEATPLSQLVPDAPPSLESILNRMLAKEPEDRFQTPTELIEALDTVSPEMTPAMMGVAAASSSQRSAPSNAEPLPKIDSSPAPQRRFSWKSWSVGVATTGCLILAVVLWPRGEQVFEAGKWYSLMEKPPKLLLWSQNLPPPQWILGRKEIVAAPAGDLGILGLGVVAPKTDYRFQVNVRQRDWTGDVGIVFGFQEVQEPGKRVAHYQTLGLVVHGAGPLRMERRRTKATISDDAGVTFQSEILAFQLVNRPPREEESLEIVVQGGSLFRVLWAGGDVPMLCQKAVNEKLVEPDYAGAVGVFCSNSMAIFRNGELMLLPR